MAATEATVSIDSCPACRTAAPAPVGGTADGFDEWVAGRNFRQPSYAVCRCEVCGLYFKTEVLSSAALSEYYQLLDSAPFDYDGKFPTDEILTRRLGTLAAGSRVLDYGCSTGRILKGHSGRLQCVGIEPNPAAAKVADARGIKIIGEAALFQSDAAFDAVLLTDVYEHLLDPVGLLVRLVKHLTPGGWLAIVTGNADAVAVQSELASFWYFRISGHVAMASERHLLWLAERLDLTLADRQRCSHYDEPLVVRLKQHVQAFAYTRFRTRPNGMAARTMRWVPRLKAAQHWPAPPAFTCGDDHIVAIFERPTTLQRRAGVTPPSMPGQP